MNTNEPYGTLVAELLLTLIALVIVVAAVVAVFEIFAAVKPIYRAWRRERLAMRIARHREREFKRWHP